MIRSRDNQLREDDFQLDTEAQELPALLDGLAEAMTLAEVERAYILKVLELNDGNKKATAKALDIGYNTLWRKLKKYQQD